MKYQYSTQIALWGIWENLYHLSTWFALIAVLEYTVQKSLKYRQSKGDNSSITHDTLMKLHMHNHTMVMYIQYKLHEIPSISYLSMAEDGKIIEI